MITGTETAQLVPRGVGVLVDPRLPLLEPRDVVFLGLREDQQVRVTTEVRGEGLRLVLQGRPLILPPGLSVAPGDTFVATVHLLPNGGAQLRPVRADSQRETSARPPYPASTTTDLGVSQRLDRLMWRPQELSALLELLRPLSIGPLLPAQLAEQPELLQLLGQWRRNQPRMATLSASALREAVVRSGFFTEASLAKQAQSAGSDVKCLLRELVLFIQSRGMTAPQSFADAIDDIEAAQLRAAENHQNGQSMLQLAVGFADAPPVQIDVRKESNGRSDAEGVWYVDLHTSGERWGEIWLASRIETGGCITMTMWALRSDICRIAAEKTTELVETLRQWRLDLTALRIVHGTRPACNDNVGSDDAGHIVDISA